MFLVIGQTGQMARALAAVLGVRGHFLPRSVADLSQPDTLPGVLANYNPRVIINAAAYTQVDKAESEPDLARLVNAYAVGAMARYAAKHDIPFVHFSTDYVFDGSGTKPWQEDDETGPLGVYGETKLAGEREVINAGGPHLIFRISWVYDAEGKNFLNTMLRLGAEREQLSVVADQYGAPNYAPTLAEATVTAIERALAMRQFPTGIYHMSASGETSWHGFADEIFKQTRAAGVTLKLNGLNAITTADYPTPARRPQNSRLDCGKLADIFGLTLPAWQEGVRSAILEKYAAYRHTA